MKRIGTERRLEEDDRQRLVDALGYWQRNARQYYADRSRFEAAFNCEWRNQHVSGTVRNRDDKKAKPFDGASDQRLRWGETTVKDLTSLLMNAARAANVQITCTAGPRGRERAESLAVLLNWCIGKMGLAWETQLRTAVRYMLVDSPAVALVEVNWRRRANVAVEETDYETLQAEYVAMRMAEAQTQGAGGTEEDVQTGAGELELQGRFALAVQTAVMGEDEEGADAEALADVAAFMAGAKGVEEDEARQILEAIGTEPDGACEFAREMPAFEGPEIKALRYGDDFCIPTLCEDLDYASPLFRNEWVTEAQLRERVEEDDWSEAWVEETLRHPGAPIFDVERPETIDERDEMYNVVWCYEAETDEAGRTSRWVCVLSQARGSAYGQRMVRTRRGKWNAVLFRREVTSANVIDCRGIAEESASVQGVAKVIRDGAANNAIIGAQPPAKVKGTRIKNVLFQPFAKLEMGVNDDVLFMQPPAYPAAGDKQVEVMRNEFHQLEGVPSGEGSDVSQRVKDLVAWFLTHLAEVCRLVLEVTQDSISDALLATVTQSGDVKGLRREDVTGDFGISLKLDPEDLDNAKLIEKMKATGQFLLPLDRKAVTDTTPMVMEGIRQLWPGVAREAIRSPEEMTADDVKEEQQNFVLIKAGVMPRMDTEGRWNYEARLAFWRDLQQNNQAALEDMGENAMAILGEWLKALEQQATQHGENAEIGRTGSGMVQEEA